MYEHATLQEAYTGSLIAGKGRTLNSINVILERSRFKTEDWVRVRFGAGTPWRRCWCVITPPDEKAFQKQLKVKKKSAYNKRLPVLKGDIKFYDTKKTKKVQPIASMTDAYSAYAIYPQSKPLIDQSTLVKVEGTITIHSKPASTTEGFVFVMPEVHPAVSGFEIMLRWLFPVFDTFGLYGRPARLIADTLDQRGLMFAMPSERRYGYLETLDVAGLIHAEGSQNWKEAEWRKRMKDLTSTRMTTLNSRRNSRGSRQGARSSLPPTRNGVSFDDAASTRSAQSHRLPLQQTEFVPRNTSAPPALNPFATPSHNRSISEVQRTDHYKKQDVPPPPPAHATRPGRSGHSSLNNSSDAINERSSSESDTRFHPLKEFQPTSAPEPVTAPPAFAHPPGAQPTSKPYHHPELRRAKSRMSTDTLSQLAGAGGIAVAGAAAAWKTSPGRRSEDIPRDTDRDGASTDRRGAPEVQAIQGDSSRFDRALPPPPVEYQRDPSPLHQAHMPQDGRRAVELDGAQKGWRRSRTPSPSKSSYPLAIGGRQFEPRTDSLGRDSPTKVPRKPLPAAETERPRTAGSLHAVSQEGLDRVTRFPTKSSYDDINLGRQLTNSSSNYDNESTISPDYASTRKSTETKRSIDKPRAGVMKTVGTVEAVEPEVVVGDAHYSNPKKEISTDIPDVDFGPTYNYASDKTRPGTSRASGTPNEPPNHDVDNRMSSGFGSQNAKPPELDYIRTGSAGSDRRSMAWQPGMGTITGTSRALTPEQFVQQKAQSRVTPAYVHTRKQSNIRSNTPPLLSRSSPDPKNHSRQSSGERPVSRGGTAIFQSSPGDYSTHLSAREQEHVAKITGGPLVNMAPGPRSSQGGGLVGAIEAREREKQEMKQGISGQMVQQAINQRQHAQTYGHTQYGGQEVIYDANGRPMLSSATPYAPGQAWGVPNTGRRSPGTSGPFVGQVPTPEEFAARRQSQQFGNAPDGQYRR
jgi:CCR4-NOT transcriptional complex subunit CAF120